MVGVVAFGFMGIRTEPVVWPCSRRAEIRPAHECFFPAGRKIGGFRPEFPAPTFSYATVFIAINRTGVVQLNGRLDYRSKLGNNASLTEGSCSKGIDAY